MARVDDTVREPETAELLGGRYELQDQLGSGGMGRVYRARDATLGRDVAIKMIDAARVAEPAMRERFIREAHAAARLDHENIVAIYDFDAEAGWLAMELVSGVSLGDLIERDGKLEPVRVRAIAEQVLSALEAAHAAGVIHRDLKPNNIIVDESDHVTLLDFGVARLVDVAMTSTGELLGTPAYMAPEQLRGAKVDPRTDLYSLGATLYELACGERIGSFSAPNADELAMMTAACGTEVGLARVIERCLQEDPAARFSSARAARDQLAKRTLTRPIEIPRPGGVRPVFWLGLVLVLAGSLWFTLRQRRLANEQVSVRQAPASWFEQHRAQCNPVEVSLVIDDAGDYRAACYALAGKIDLARADITSMPSPEQQRDAIQLVFEVGHPVADAGNDTAAGPIMELVAELEPNHYMALYHAGMARAIADDAVIARNYLTRFLTIYTADDGWTRTARRALAALDRPRNQRTVEKGNEGNIVY